MLGFKDFLDHFKKKTVRVYRGTHSKQETFSLPESWNRGDGEDGHALYVTSHKEEAQTYGPHIHHLDMSADKDRMISLDEHPTKQPKHVLKVFRKLAPEVLKPDFPARVGKKPNGQDAYYHIADKVGGPVEATKLLASHGIHGGIGESSWPGGTPTTVYSLYNPKKHLKVVSHEFNQQFRFRKSTKEYEDETMEKLKKLMSLKKT